MNYGPEPRPILTQIIDLLRAAALRVTKLAAQLATWAHQLDRWMTESRDQSLIELLDTILATLQRHIRNPLIADTVAVIRTLLGSDGLWGSAGATT